MSNHNAEFATRIDALTTRAENLGMDRIISEFMYGYLTTVPTVFFTAPASSSGKYHPNFSLGDGGLLRHKVVALEFCAEFAKFLDLDPVETNAALLAAAIHDTYKGGDYDEWGKTLPEHANIAAEKIEKFWNVYKKTVSLSVYRDVEEVVTMAIEAVTQHMGIWSSPDPFNPSAMYPHCLCVAMADYAASRKLLNNEDLSAKLDPFFFECFRCGSKLDHPDETCPACTPDTTE